MEENSNDQVTVLVVDDEPNIVELLTVSLKFQGFNVRSANSGTEALRIAREINPEAYILDVMIDRKSTRLNSSHVAISYAVFCLKKKIRYITSMYVLSTRK